LERESGMFAEGTDPEAESPRLHPVQPTRGTRIPERPEPTPTTRAIDNFGTTAGTRSYRSLGGTPSTQRIHNPPQHGR
jgi:hypothetical protein